jgi:hypothetical protein
MYTDTNIIGERGENLATGILMTDEIFFAKVLGGKVPSFDVYAEVCDILNPYPLLIQIKTTTKKNRYNKSTIKTSVPDKTIQELSARPIPTYVAGFDMVDNILYVAPVFSGKEHYPSIPISHKIELSNPTNAVVELNLLKDDVINFYKNKVIDIQKYKKSYISQL